MGGLGKELCWGAGPSSEACRDGEMKLLTVMGWGWVRQGCPVLEGVSCAEWGWEGGGGEGSASKCSPSKEQGLPKQSAQSIARCHCLSRNWSLVYDSGLCKACQNTTGSECNAPAPWASLVQLRLSQARVGEAVWDCQGSLALSGGERGEERTRGVT